MIAINNKVVCIGDVRSPGAWAYAYPNGYVKKGEIYVVEGMDMHKFDDQPVPVLCLFLVGKKALHISLNEERGWHAEKFRKLEYVQEINRLKAQIGQPQESFK